jgi:thiamine-monophosphate kinase
MEKLSQSKSMKETDIIQKFFKKKLLPQDDCYLWKQNTLITTDTICEGTHFLHEWSSPEDVAIKLVEVNVSDMVASGGIPELCFLNLGLSAISQEASWIYRFSKRFRKTLQKYSIELAGGDTYFSLNTNLSLTLLGKTEKYISRSTGQIGDFLYLTGELGYSKLGYKVLKDNLKLPQKAVEKKALKRHLSPQSRFFLAQRLWKFYTVHAMMDITDGLVQDAKKLSSASLLSLEIDIRKIPGYTTTEFLSIDEFLTSGEELELLFLSPDEIDLKGITKIGKTQKTLKPTVKFMNEKVEYVPAIEGFIHF